MDLVNFLAPKHVILVHGEKHKMASLKEKIHSEFGIQCYDPANNETICIPSTHYVNAEASHSFIRSCLSPNFTFQKCSSVDICNSSTIDKSLMPMLQVEDERVSEGVFVVEKGKKAKIVHKDELLLMLEEPKHEQWEGRSDILVTQWILVLVLIFRTSLRLILKFSISWRASANNRGSNVPTGLRKTPNIKAVYFCCF